MQSVKALMGISAQFYSDKTDKTITVPDKTCTHKGVHALCLDFGPPRFKTESCVCVSFLSLIQSIALVFCIIFQTFRHTF